MNKVESESKSESKSENRNDSKRKTNKVKDINNSKTEFRIKLEGRQDKVRKVQTLKNSILKFSFHWHLTATVTMYIPFFNFFVLDHFDHHCIYPFQSFTFKDFKDCEKHYSVQMKFLHSAKTAKTHPAILESTILPRTPETRPTELTRDLGRNILVPVTLPLIGQPRTSESNIQIDSFFSNT